jgi:hypothetical protein
MMTPWCWPSASGWFTPPKTRKPRADGFAEVTHSTDRGAKPRIWLRDEEAIRNYGETESFRRLWPIG